MIAALILLVAASTGDQPTCQDIGVAQADGTVVPTLMCRGADGRWRPASAAATPQSGRRQVLDAPSSGGMPRRSEVTYEGSFDVKTAQPMRMPTSLSLGSMLSSMSRARGNSMQGALTLVAVFNGEALTAQSSGTGGLRAGRLSGLIQGDHCHLVTADEMTVYDGECGPQGFAGRISAGPRNRENVSGTFRLRATRVVDVAERERQQQVSAAQAATARAAAAEAERARIAALPAAGPVYTTRLATQVQTDSRGWAFNHLDAGSIHNVKVASGSVRSGDFVLRGEYTYNGGAPGWVLAKYAAGRFDCIQFWDAMVGCRGLRTEADGEGMRTAALGLLSSGGDSGSSGSSVSDRDLNNAAFDMQIHRNRAEGLNDNGTPK